MSHHYHHHSHDENIEVKSTKDKLRILLKHWKEHNDSHLIEYEKWLKKAQEEGLDDYADILKEIIAKLKEIDSLYEKMEDLK